MKATKIYYKKLINLGHFSHEEIGIEIQIDKGEKAQEVLDKAKKFVEENNPKNDSIIKYAEAKEILKNPDDYNFRRVKEAEKYIQEFEQNDEILPF